MGSSRLTLVLRSTLQALVFLAPILILFFWRSLEANYLLFSNDGPLGINSSAASKMPEAFFGAWQDLNWVGGKYGSAYPSLTYGLFYLLGPVSYLKFYTPLSLLFFGGTAAFFAASLQLPRIACVAAAVAAALNMDFFSNACWGLGSKAITAGCAFVAMGLIAQAQRSQPILRTLLAGFAVGMGVMDGYDVGAIFSIYVAAFAIYVGFGAKDRMKGLLKAGLQVATIAVVSGVVATHALISLVSTQVQGVSTLQGGAESRQERWDWATQWSLPKIEVLRVAIPGLFGYRMDSPDGANYWGAVGRQPGWEVHKRGLLRYSGAGEYAGTLVLLVAFWALIQAWNRKSTSLQEEERRLVKFWSIAALISLLLAFGRHAPLYQGVFALPFFSTIRNPIKFMHLFHIGLLVLFMVGLAGIWRRSLAVSTSSSGSPVDAIKAWWRNAKGGDRTWARFMALVPVVGLVGWLLYAGSRPDLVRYLQTVGFEAPQAAEIAMFSGMTVGWFFLFSTLSAVALALVLSGYFAKRPPIFAIALVVLVLGLDLYRANRPWVVHYDYKDKYASNPVVDLLRNNPHEGRVTLLPFQGDQITSFFQQLYQVEWVQHLFQYYNIQSLDVIQEPREASDNKAFRETLMRTNVALLPRLWELTNTRFFLGPAGGVQVLNEQLDGGKGRFVISSRFDLVPKPGRSVNTGIQLSDLTVALNTNGPLALIEFKGSLPRATVVHNWVVSTNDALTLNRLKSDDFIPSETALLDRPVSLPTPAPGSKAGPSAARITRYAPKSITVSVEASAPGILLLNDKYDPDWKVTVNGQAVELVRANFMMRGVPLGAGKHEVQFSFVPSTFGFTVSVSAIAVCLLLCGLLCFVDSREPAADPEAPATTA